MSLSQSPELVMQLQAKEYRQPLEAEKKQRMGSSLEPPEKTQLCQ